MKAVLLVGGRGTRLRPLTFAIPKPLLAVQEKPILQFILEQLRESGFRQVILATGYLAELIEAFCGDGSRFGLEISYARETQPLGTAGPLTLVRDRLGRNEFFLLMNGDILTRLDFRSLLRFAEQREYELTCGYVRRVYQSPYGVLDLRDDVIVRVTEKPKFEYCVSGGIYILKGSVLDHIPDGQFFTIPNLIEKLQAVGCSVGAYEIKEFWLGVEDPEHIAFMTRVLNGQLPES